MKRFGSLVLTMVSIGGLLTSVGGAQVQLPDAPGKEETVRLCGTCHEAQRAASVRLTREGWQETIAKMVTIGAAGSEQELAKVLHSFPTRRSSDLRKSVV